MVENTDIAIGSIDLKYASAGVWLDGKWFFLLFFFKL